VRRPGCTASASLLTGVAIVVSFGGHPAQTFRVQPTLKDLRPETKQNPSSGNPGEGGSVVGERGPRHPALRTSLGL